MTANAAARRASRLLGFYVDKSRDLPWRPGPGEEAPDPYCTWLSEIMLQQTTVAAVMPRFARFLKRWPTVEALASASEAEVLGEWAGLGYYARARNLIACARKVAGMGGFPKTRDELRRLPGLGDYTAAAIAAIAFGEDCAPIDTNVARVIARLHGLADPRRAEIERLFLELAPTGHAGDVAQALMDLGATICRPRQPRCGLCPLSQDCQALANGDPTAFPRPKERRQRPHRYGSAWWIESGGGVWLVRRPASGLLGGMAALPGDEWGDSASLAGERRLGSVRHVFTHFALELTIFERDSPVGEGWWQPLDALTKAGLPTLYRRAAELAFDARHRGSEPAGRGEADAA